MNIGENEDKKISIKERRKKIVKQIKKYIKNLVSFFCMKILYPFYYKLCIKKDINASKVVFVEPRFTKITNSFELLYNKLSTEYNFDIEVVFLGQGLVRFIRQFKNAMKLIKEIASAKYVFINDSVRVLDAFKLREETSLIQVWHACGAFKKFGYSVVDKIFGMNPKEIERYGLHKNYTYAFVSGEEVRWAYIEAFGMENTPEKVLPIGISRTDVFFDEEFKKNAYEKLYDLFPEAKDKKVILYCPTFRGRVAKAKSPNKLKLDQLQELSSEYVFIYKHHPFVKKLPKVPKRHAYWAKDFTKKAITTEELLCVSDVCITDYSSIVFEYSLLDKPILFYAYDVDAYDDWRGFYYDFNDFVPGPIVKTNLEVLDTIHDINKFNYSKLREFKEKFMSACDGHSTDKILNLVFKEELEKHKIKNSHEDELYNI